MKDKTLLILAAGMGSRFGGLKQIEPVGPNGEFIIDYSIYDAIRAGFNKVVFIIKEENYELFRNTIGKRVESQIKTEYAFQKNDDIPKGYSVPEGRIKPWGTAHAILAAKDKVKENFIIINADDFYGRDAFEVASKFFDEKEENKEKEHYAMVGYQAKNTLSANGTVKRGVCTEENGYLKKITESVVEEKNGVITASPLSGDDPFVIDSASCVSMNMFTFNPSLFAYLEKDIVRYFKENKDNLEKCEYLITDVVFKMIGEGLCDMKVLPTKAKWQGITYRDDKPQLVAGIQKLIDEKEYPQNLWKKEK